MIKTWLKDKKEGRPLWLAECREEIKTSGDATETKISVITSEGESREFPLMLPRVEFGEEFELMTKYLDANRVNAAALLGQLDSEDCKAIDVSAVLAKMGSSKTEDTYQMPEEPLVCGIDVGGSDIKLLLAEGDRIRRILCYDWNLSICEDPATVLNPVYELIEMAANGMKLDGIGIAFDESEYQKSEGLIDFLRPLCKEGAPIRMLDGGYMAAFAVYNELQQSEAGRELIKDGIIALPIGTDIGFGWVRGDGSIPKYPGNLCKCRFRFDSDEDAGFFNQEKILKAANMPVKNPKPCIDLLVNMAEGGEPNAETVFKNLGQYIGHAIREIDYFMQPKTNKYILLGRLASSEYVFDLMSLGLQQIAPDAVVLQLDNGIANTPLMKALAEIDSSAVTEFVRTVGCIYYL